MTHKLNSLLIATLISCLPHTVSAAPQVQRQRLVITEEDKCVTQCQEQLSEIERILRSLHITVVKEKLYTPKRRAAIQEFISKLMVLIQSIQAESFRNADTNSFQLLVNLNYQLAQLINKQCKTEFRNARSFDIEAFIATSQPRKQLSQEQTVKRFQATWRVLGTIRKEGLGLSALNKTIRWIDDNLIATCQRYSIPTRGMAGLASTFFGFYFWNKYQQSLVESSGRKKETHRNIFPAIYDPIFAFDDMWSKMIKHKAPVGEVGGGMVAALLMKEFYSHIKPELSKRWAIWLNKAKGGSYLREADRIDEKTEKVFFDDVYGQEEIKRYFRFLVDYLEDSETHDRQGVRPPRGILCIGDTRTGKTFCIKAFLNEVDRMLINTGQMHKFRLIKPSVLRIKIEGMEKILREAKAKAPCVLFIDEIDLLDLQRTGENRTLSEFLTAMGEAVDSNDSRRQIFIIAATNCPETLDKALRQPGRFGKEIRFEYPNFKDRKLYICEKVLEFILPDQEKEFDFDKLALYTHNQSYEAMNLFIKNAMMRAKIDNNGELTQRHLEEALEEDVFHIIPAHSKAIPAHEEQILAAHFAGQALMLQLLDGNQKLAKVTIKQVMTELKEKVMGSHLWDAKNEQQRFEYGKLFTYCKDDSIAVQTREEKLDLIKVNLAGFAAEELLLGSCGYSCHAEKESATTMQLAKSLVFQGVDEATLPKHLIKSYYDKVEALKDEAYQQVKQALQENKPALQKVAAQLIEHQTLDAAHIQRVIES